jgi:tetratricopeptide (TPR) repeat protein
LLVLARVQERLGDPAQAERTLNRVTKLDPKLFEPWFQSARLASQAKDYKREASLLDKALEMLDWTWDNYFKYNNPEPEDPPTP